jgi:Helix-turn-helix domain
VADISPRWLTLSDAGKYASMSERTLKRHILNGEIYAIKKGKWYVDKESIDAFMMQDAVDLQRVLENLK